MTTMNCMGTGNLHLFNIRGLIKMSKPNKTVMLMIDIDRATKLRLVKDEKRST